MTGKWVLITGGAGYVGQTAAQTLLELGASVVLLDKDQASLTQAKQQLASTQVETISCDLLSIESIDACIALLKNITGGKLTTLINNAAFVGTSELTGWAVPFEQQSVETWKQCLDINLTAPFYLAQQCLPLFNASQGDKSIINISSIYAVVGPQMSMYEGTTMGNPAAYAASKAGLMQLTRWLSSVVAPNIRVNNIVLGGIFRQQAEAFLNKYNQKVPLNRMATEQDIKGAIAYLSTELSAYMTGQSLTLDGGWTAV